MPHFSTLFQRYRRSKIFPSSSLSLLVILVITTARSVKQDEAFKTTSQIVKLEETFTTETSLESRLDCRQNYSKGNELNFFATAYRDAYEDMLPMYAFMALSTHMAEGIDATIEMRVADIDNFLKRHWRSLLHLLTTFGNHSVCLGSFSSRTMSLTSLQNTWRYLEAPVRRWTKYTYIGDIDIFFTEPVLSKKRFQQMKYFNLSYSNVIRPNTERLTGVMLVETKLFYHEKLLELQRNTSWVKEQISFDKNDENFLYHLVKNAGLGLPDTYNATDRMTYYRPIHGLHLSNNRGPFERICHDPNPGLMMIEKILNVANFKRFFQVDSSGNKNHNHFLYRFIGQMFVEKEWQMENIDNQCQWKDSTDTFSCNNN